MSVENGEQPEAADAPDEPVGEIFARLVDSGKDYARAEADRQKARAALVGTGVRDTVILYGIAAILLFAALVTLLVGLIWILAPLLTIAGATAAVIGGALLIVAGLLAAGTRRIKAMMKALRP